jgi:hypothetical protein
MAWRIEATQSLVVENNEIISSFGTDKNDAILGTSKSTPLAGKTAVDAMVSGDYTANVIKIAIKNIEVCVVNRRGDCNG